MNKNSNFILFGVIVILVYLYLQEKNKNDINIYITDSESSDEESYEEPMRYYDSRYYPRERMDINVPTRGEPPEYQQVGILKGDGDEDNIKPLYGRQTYRGSNQWNYFTSLDSHLSTKVPVYQDNNDCTDERGCSEIYKNDNVKFGENGTTYSASIYNTKAPRYIPYI